MEPEFQPISTETFRNLSTNTQDGDIRSYEWFLGWTSERAFVDVKVFNPYAPSNSNLSTTSCYKKHENIKKHAYEQRLREVEHSSFMPLIFSATDGMAPEAAVFTRLASQLALKWNDHYSITMGWLRCSLSYSLLRSAIQCLHRVRSSMQIYIWVTTSLDLVRCEAKFPLW